MACAKTCVLLCLCCSCCCCRCCKDYTELFYLLTARSVYPYNFCMSYSMRTCPCVRKRVLHMVRSLYLSRLSVSLSLSPYRGRAVVASVPSICRRCPCVAFLRSTARPNIYNNFFVNGNEGSKFLVVAHSLSLSLAVASPALTTDSFAQYVCNQLKLKPATNGHV